MLKDFNDGCIQANADHLNVWPTLVLVCLMFVFFFFFSSFKLDFPSFWYEEGFSFRP